MCLISCVSASVGTFALTNGLLGDKANYVLGQGLPELGLIEWRYEMSVFDNRTLNEEEKRNLKIAVEDTVEAMRQIDDLNNHIKENNKGICDSLNENVSVPEQKIKPSMIKKMAKARLKEEYLAKAKDELNETEEALVVVYGEGV